MKVVNEMVRSCVCDDTLKRWLSINGVQPILYLGNSLANMHIGIPKVVFKIMADRPKVGNCTNVLS